MPAHITADTIKRHINGLQSIGTQLEREGDPRWIGLDMAKPGKDMTVTFRRTSHA